MRPLVTIAFATQLAVSAFAAEVKFISPLEGSQAIGVVSLEVTTDARQVDRVEFRVDGVLSGVVFKPPYRLAHDFGDSIAAREITADVYSSLYKSRDRATIRTAALTLDQTINVDLVEVPVQLRSRAREFRAADFDVRENGVRQTISEVRSQRPPARFVFVVDRSLSMADGKLDAALRAIERELSSLRSGDTAELTLFNHQISETKVIREGEPLDRGIVPSGGTSLRDAVASARGRGRTVVIVISDGGDRNSALSIDAALERIATQELSLYALTLGSRDAEFLDRAATQTGGRVVRSSAGDLQHDLGAILDDINSRYTLVYQSSNSAPGWRRIEVGARKRGVSIVNSRRGYFSQ